jgi:hypothetical protein
MLQGSLVTWTAVSLPAAKFKPLIFSVSLFAFCYDANMIILMILYDSCLLSAQFYTIVRYIGNAESRMQIADRCKLWRISSGAEYTVSAAQKNQS